MNYDKPDHSEIPRVIGHRYEMVRQLREEPWGEVWLARDNFLGAEMGLKILQKEAPDWLEAKNIFEQEALLALTLRHPQILGVFYLGETEKLLYLVQEPFAGESLITRLARQQRLTLLQSLHVLEQVSQALALAHQKGVAHQSFSPLHILLQGEETRVANFTFPPRDEDQATHLELKAYHPPEAVQGEAVTPAGNIFSLGVLGFRLVAGSLPYPLTFDEPFPYRLETPPVDLEEIPIPLQNVLLRCLAVEPEERFPDADAFLSQLRQIREPWRSGRPERAAAWDLENRRSTWPKAAPAVELGAKMWALTKGGARKIGELIQTHGPKLRQAPRRLWWGLGLVGVLVILFLVGNKLMSKPDTLPPPGTLPAPPPAAATGVKLPTVGGGPPLVETGGAASKPEPAAGEAPATEAITAPTAPAPAAPAPEAKLREERYLILVATYAKEDQARALSRSLRAKNYKAQVVKKTTDGKVKYQVQIGPVTGTKQAEEMARRLKTQEKITPKIQKIAVRTAAQQSPPRAGR